MTDCFSMMIALLAPVSTSSIGEFIPVVDKTIEHYRNISNRILPDEAEIEKHERIRGKNMDEGFREKHEKFRRRQDECHKKLVDIKERFERQRDRATALRDAVGLRHNNKPCIRLINNS